MRYDEISEEIKKKFGSPKKHERLVFLIDGKPMELPAPLKKMVEEKFGPKNPNYTIIRKVKPKEDDSK